MRDFGVNKTTVQWLTTGFLLVMGAFTPITAGVIQWLDTRRMVLLTQAVFLTGSLVCAFAPTFGVLVAGRMVQAVSAAFFVPLLFNGILSIYPPARRGTAMGVITMMFTAAPAMGPDTPSQHYRSSPREFPEHLAPIEYPPGDLVRKTDTNGHISLPGRQVRIGKGLVGQTVACRPVPSEDGVYEVYFCFYRLGRIDLNDFC